MDMVDYVEKGCKDGGKSPLVLELYACCASTSGWTIEGEKIIDRKVRMVYACPCRSLADPLDHLYHPDHGNGTIHHGSHGIRPRHTYLQKAQQVWW